jgi:hypothetical protein
MIIESWSIALITCALVTVVFGAIGAVTALQVVRYWDPGSDTERQINLEERVWLAATLVQFGLVVQVISAVIFIYAADYFATILTGAMCAAGSLTANEYGLPALGVKLATIFLAGLWIVVHRLDIGRETFPLTRLKSVWLMLLQPLLIGDALLVLLYLINLEPEIITSCCGIIFGEKTAGGFSLLEVSSPFPLLLSAGISIAVIMFVSWLLTAEGKGGGQRHRRHRVGGWVMVGAWLSFYLLALLVITVLVSPYVYGLPHHRCPFDLLQYPYAPLGLPLYLFLHAAVFSGMAGGTVAILSGRETENLQSDSFIRRSIQLSLVMLIFFLAAAGFAPLRYIYFGGQW